jgi:hypothetical protein
MGQRSQLIVMLPEKYYNEGNVNNKPQMIKVFHNQWLYGQNFLKWLDRFMRAIEERHKLWGNLTGWVTYVLGEAMGYANFSDLNYCTNTHEYEADADYNKDLKEMSITDFIGQFDNNNGYMFVKLEKDGSISWDILNGTEDAEDIKRRSPEEYLKLFYPEDDLKEEWSDMQEVFKSIESRTKTDIFKELETFKKTLK